MSELRSGAGWYPARRLATAAVTLSFAMSVAFCAPFSLRDYVQKRFHPESVREHDVEGLDQHIRDGKLVLDLKAFLSLLLKNSTDIRLTQLDVYTAADAITSAQAPFDPQLLLSFNATRSVQTEASQISGAATLTDLAQNSVGRITTRWSATGPHGGRPASTPSVTSSNSAFSFFNPSISTGLNISASRSRSCRAAETCSWRRAADDR